MKYVATDSCCALALAGAPRVRHVRIDGGELEVARFNMSVVPGRAAWDTFLHGATLAGDSVFLRPGDGSPGCHVGGSLDEITEQALPA